MGIPIVKYQDSTREAATQTEEPERGSTRFYDVYGFRPDAWRTPFRLPRGRSAIPGARDVGILEPRSAFRFSRAFQRDWPEAGSSDFPH
jgi:hypothetical protein